MTEEQIQKKSFWVKKKDKTKNEKFKITEFELLGPAVFIITIKLWKYLNYIVIRQGNVRISFF